MKQLVRTRTLPWGTLGAIVFVDDLNPSVETWNVRSFRKLLLTKYKIKIAKFFRIRLPEDVRVQKIRLEVC